MRLGGLGDWEVVSAALAALGVVGAEVEVEVRGLDSGDTPSVKEAEREREAGVGPICSKGSHTNHRY